MAKIDKRSGSYTTRVSLTNPDTGERIQPRVTARTKKELDARVTQLKAQHRKGELTATSDVTLIDWIDRWFARYRKSAATRINRKWAIENHIRPHSIATVKLGRLRTAHVQDFADTLATTLSPDSVHHVISVIRMACKHAVRMKEISANPCAGIELPPLGQATWQVLSRDEARRFIDATTGTPLHAYWLLAITLGIRRGELSALRWSDVDLERGLVTVQRTMTRAEDGKWIVGEYAKTSHSRRTLSLPLECLAALKAYRTAYVERQLLEADVWQGTGAVFDDGTGGHWKSANHVYWRFKRLIAELNLTEVTLHELRHTAATHMLRANVPVTTVSRILGHKTASITLNVYAHVIEGMMDEAVERIDAMYRPTGTDV